MFAGVLDVNGAGAQRLRERGSENLQVLQLDVTDSSQVETVHSYICNQVGRTGESELVSPVICWSSDDRESVRVTWSCVLSLQVCGVW